MAALEQRGNCYRIIFRFQGKRYARTLRTRIHKEAMTLKGGIEATLMRLQQQLLTVPEGMDAISFIMGGGIVQTQPSSNRTQRKHPDVKCADKSPTLAELAQEYLTNAAVVGALEANSLKTVQIHLRHFEKSLGIQFPIQS